ncbi:MAG: polysaccharide biosynthesis/export family protein [Pseudomonadota bacterium]
MLIFTLLGACSSSVSRTGELPANLELPDSTTLQQSADIRIGPLDLIGVRVFGVEELDGKYQVDHLGQVKMPLIGTVRATGYTSLQLAAILEYKLGETYLQDPDVNVTILEGIGEQVTIEGSVAKPGMYKLDGQITLLQAVALGGGTTRDANPERVIVFRTVDDERRAAGFNLRDIRAGKAEDPAIFGNDIVVVDGSAARQTYGDFLRSVPLIALFLVY